MGGVQNAGSDPLGALVNVYTLGMFGSGGFISDEGFEQDKGGSSSSQSSAPTSTAVNKDKQEPVQTADITQNLLDAQGDRRKRYLLQQTTGRTPIQAPAITQNPKQRTLLG